jgi:hypothetical protein
MKSGKSYKNNASLVSAADASRIAAWISNAVKGGLTA